MSFSFFSFLAFAFSNYFPLRWKTLLVFPFDTFCIVALKCLFRHKKWRYSLPVRLVVWTCSVRTHTQTDKKQKAFGTNMYRRLGDWYQVRPPPLSHANAITEKAVYVPVYYVRRSKTHSHHPAQWLVPKKPSSSSSAASDRSKRIPQKNVILLI